MKAYIINMDTATARWDHVVSGFAGTGIELVRFSAVVGRSLNLPIPAFDEAAYRRHHGRRPSMGTIGCYLSHLGALQRFLESDEAYAIIGEDDIRPVPHLLPLIEAAIEHRDTWDILRLSGFHDAHPRRYASLGHGAHLAVNLTRLCGSGAYVVHRRAAAVLIDKLMPMHVPLDHALDREWFYGLRAAAIDPLPIDQEDHVFSSQINTPVREKLPALQRYWTVFPYRLYNESCRLVVRYRQARQMQRRAVRRSSAA